MQELTTREAAARKRVVELKQNPLKVRTDRFAKALQKCRSQMYGVSMVVDLGGTKMPSVTPGTLTSDFQRIGKDFRIIGDDFRTVLTGEIKRLQK